MIALKTDLILLEDLLLFVRLYESEHESLMYIGHFHFPQKQPFRKLQKSSKDEQFTWEILFFFA